MVSGASGRVKGPAMTRDEEILQLLREIKDAQQSHHAEWQQVVRRAEEHQQHAVRDVAKAKRSMWIPLGALIVVIIGINYLPRLLHSPGVPQGMPESARYNHPIATPIFDGGYQLDTERSFSGLRKRLAEADPDQQPAVKRLLALAERQFVNFSIKHGVITSGQPLMQEFHLVAGSTIENHLQGRAIWHEDLHDPGDCSIVNVSLKIEGKTLLFSYFPDGEEAGEPVVLTKITPEAGQEI